MDDTDARAKGIWPELELLAQPARDRRRLPPETRSRIILDLCARSPLSVKEMSELLDRSEAYIGDAIRPLVTDGSLTFLFPDQPRHPRQKYVTKAATPEPVSPPEPDPVSVRTPVAAPAPAAARAPAPVPFQVPAPAPSRRRFKPNQWTNGIFVVIVGIILARFDIDLWALFAAAAGVLLAWLHIFTNSPQYQRFRDLHSSNRARRRTAFILLKAGVALVEISIIYFATTAITHRG